VIAVRGLAELPWDRCRCGHERQEHYAYPKNGVETTRCRMCDPFARAGASAFLVSLEPGTYLHAMHRAADHDFEPEDDQS
jgi:hypothetical protein